MIYSIAGVVVLSLAGLMIYQALANSLVYYILPSEYAQDPAHYTSRRIRLGGIVKPGSVQFDSAHSKLSFTLTDTYQSYPVMHTGTPPDLFQEETGIVVEGGFEGEMFVSDNLLIKHSEVYRAPEGEQVDLDTLKDALR